APARSASSTAASALATEPHSSRRERGAPQPPASRRAVRLPTALATVHAEAATRTAGWAPSRRHRRRRVRHNTMPATTAPTTKRPRRTMATRMSVETDAVTVVEYTGATPSRRGRRGTVDQPAPSSVLGRYEVASRAAELA